MVTSAVRSRITRTASAPQSLNDEVEEARATRWLPPVPLEPPTGVGLLDARADDDWLQLPKLDGGRRLAHRDLGHLSEFESRGDAHLEFALDGLVDAAGIDVKGNGRRLSGAGLQEGGEFGGGCHRPGKELVVCCSS